MKRKLTALVSALIISCTSLCEPVQDLIGISVTAEAASVVEAPTASKKSGTYTVSSGMKITLSCNTKGAKIYYSTDGGNKYKTYSKALSITKNTTVKFYAKKNGEKSKVVSRTYKLTPKFSVSPEAGSYTAEKNVKITTEAEGVKFYYTLDGSKPNKKSTAYTSKGITVNKTSKLRILAVKSGWTSRYVSKSYTIGKSSSSAKISSESIVDDFKSKYAYSTLTAKQKKLYELMYNGINEHTKTINVSSSKAVISDLMPVIRAIEGDNPQIFWINGALSYTYYGKNLKEVTPVYIRSKSETAKIQKTLDKNADKIVKKALEYDNVFERVLYLHDAVINSTTYIQSSDTYISYADGPLVYGYALCEGYSKAFTYLCQLIGVEAVNIMGYSGNSHMWSMVKLEGKWYHVDVTFDDPISEKPTLGHDYFGLTTKEISKTHTIDNPFPAPKATATKYNYFNAKGIKIYSKTNDAYSALVEEAVKNYKKKVYRTEVVCDSTIVTSVMMKINTNIFNDLARYGCYPSSGIYGQLGRSVYIELKP